MKTVAALDLGSNTFLLLIAKVEKGVIKEVLTDQVRLTRLGQGVDQSRRFHHEALQRVDACFAEYASMIDSYNVDEIIAYATSAARDVKNKEEFFKLGEKHGIPIQVISGHREAEVTYWGSLFDVSEQKAMVIDIGGGSTEIITFDEEQKKLVGKSLDIGSVRLTEKFVSTHPIKKLELEAMSSYIKAELVQGFDSLKPHFEKKSLVAVAGTPVTLTRIEKKLSEYREEDIHNYQLALKTTKNWVEHLAQLSLNERVQLIGMEPKRADVIVAGSLILKEAMEYFGQSKIVVSTKGIRYGILMFS